MEAPAREDAVSPAEFPQQPLHEGTLKNSDVGISERCLEDADEALRVKEKIYVRRLGMDARADGFSFVDARGHEQWCFGYAGGEASTVLALERILRNHPALSVPVFRAVRVEACFNP